jgi:heat-inducible transcriptional repressor
MLTRTQDFEELDSRSRDVLREIVLEYVASGEPISSRSLAKSGRFSLSPASLRNVMADLEDLGYLFQPHTSAGRVPTDRGYRFFIDHLMKSRQLTPHEREAIDEQVSHVNELDDVMQLASRLLSKLSNQVGVVLMPTVRHLVMRSIDFILVAERKILCVIVATNGVVVNRIVETSVDSTRDELEKISRYLTGQYSGRTLEAVRNLMTELLAADRVLHDESLRKGAAMAIDAVDEVLPQAREIFVEGASSMLYKPEFADADSMRKTFLAFQEKEKLVEILNRCLTEEGLQIFVGSESQFTRSYNFSLVATRYGSSMPIGMLGIIGPTRMEYGRIAPLVDYLGKALSRKIEERETGA